MEEWPPIWRVAANTLNKQLWRQHGMVLEFEGLGIYQLFLAVKKMPCYETSTIALGLD
jgi:hypothetical protein